MIIGIGVDLVHAHRVRELIDRYGDRFLLKIFLPNEIRYCQHGRTNHLSFAAHIAAKEACSKAIATGWRQGVHWKCFEVTHEPSGKPTITMHGRALEIAAQLGVSHVAVSLSHDDEYAIAQVVMESQ